MEFNMKISVFILMVIMLAAVSSCDNKAITVGKPAFITATSLNCRDQAGTSGKITGNFKQSEKVMVLEVSSKKDKIDNIEANWYYIQNDDVKGWVFGGYLSRSLYENKDELIGNYYMRFGDQADNVYGNVILSIEKELTYTLIYFSQNESDKIIDETGSIVFTDDSIVFKPQKRITQMYLIDRSPYDSYSYDSYGNIQSPTVTEFSKEASETYQYSLFIRKYKDKVYLAYSSVPPYEVTRENSYLEKK